MEMRNIPGCGLALPVVGIGCNNFGGRSGLEETRAVVHKALDVGITFFDTADVYPSTNKGQSETLLGQVLGARRKDVVIASKFGIRMDGPAGASRRYIVSAVEASLRRLGTDWIDLYQLHRPDPQTPLAETLRALDDLVRAGKVRYVGCSNFAAWQVADAHWIAKELGIDGFVSCQNEYSLLRREMDHELIPALTAFGKGLLPYFPLAGGMLTGKYKPQEEAPAATRFAKTKVFADMFMTERNWTIVQQLEAFCAERGRTMVELAFSWLATRPALWSIIAGASTPAQVEQNAAACEWRLAADDLAEIDRITAPAPLGSH
ncbi:MAG TPA: aldo/keto reductase [Hyphomicrobiales bacterium]|nr:aldo/keto reductase [Hyphomicrobiales bacterium]